MSIKFIVLITIASYDDNNNNNNIIIINITVTIMCYL